MISNLSFKLLDRKLLLVLGFFKRFKELKNILKQNISVVVF